MNAHRFTNIIPPRELTQTERSLLERLLSCDFPGVVALRSQLTSVRVKEECIICPTIGFFMAPLESMKARVNRRIPIEAEGKDLDGITIHVLLHVVDGFMDELEIFREDPESIRELPPIETFELVNLDK